MFGSNFDPKVMLAGGELAVSGTSNGLDGGEVVSRNVALQQGTTIAHGPVRESLRWGPDGIPANGIGAGEALAIGTETYVMTGNTPAFGTFTWSQVVTVEE